MKKFFTLIAMSILALSAQAITIYVESEEAPFIWAWGATDANNEEVDLSALFTQWPGDQQFTGKWKALDGTEYWTYSFPENVARVSFLFNNGASEGTKQTSDFTGATTDRYFTLAWDDGEGNIYCEDITESFIELPDAEVTKVSLVGNHNGWSGDSQWFDVIEAGKKFSITVNTEEYSIEENLWQFKYRANGEDWVGYWNVYYNEADPDPEDGRVPNTNAPEWLGVTGDGNFLIDLEEGTTEKVFTIEVTWNGGKYADKNWSFNIQAGSTGITTLKANNGTDAKIYNLQGQRVDAAFRGIGIQNGKKVVMK